jgi:hypothetical protein
MTNDDKTLFNYDADHIIIVMFKVRTIQNQFRNRSYFQQLNLSAFNKLYQIFSEFWKLRNEDYTEARYTQIKYYHKIIEQKSFQIRMVLNLKLKMPQKHKSFIF